MARRKTDFSRMVTLDLSPTEAALLSELLTLLTRRVPDTAGELQPVLAVIEGWADHLDLQLDRLQWPQERRKAPFPV